MTYNPQTLDSTCDKCSYSWKGRTGEAPKKCPSCGSMAWNSGVRKFTSILARAGDEDQKTKDREFCILDLLTDPSTITTDTFFISAQDIKTYLNRARMPIGSAVLFVGEFEVHDNKQLIIKDLKLVYCHERAFRAYNALNLIYQKRP